MTRFDLTPFYRNSVGIDRLSRIMDELETRNAGNYPPYNIISTGEDKYEIEMAIAGFAQNEVSVSAQNGQLHVVGEKAEEVADESKQYLHRGISARHFRRVFDLADYVEVQSALMKDGILTIKLERVIPDALKPKLIEVQSA